MRTPVRLEVVLLALALLLALQPAAMASEEADPLEQRGGVLELPLTDLTREVARRTGRGILITGEVRESKLRLILPGGRSVKALDDTTLLKLFLSALDDAGIAWVPGERYDQLAPKARAAGMPIPTFVNPAQLPDDDRRVTAFVPLRHLDVGEAEKLAAPLLSKGGKIVPHPRSRQLVFIEQSRNLKRILQVLKTVDQPSGDSAEIFIIDLHHGDAEALRSVLEGLDASP